MTVLQKYRSDNFKSLVQKWLLMMAILKVDRLDLSYLQDTL